MIGSLSAWEQINVTVILAATEKTYKTPTAGLFTEPGAIKRGGNMSNVQRVKEYTKNNSKKEDFGIINIIICDRCGIEKPLESSIIANLNKLVWVKYNSQDIDICPNCLSSVEFDAANRHIQKEITTIDNMMKKISLKLKYLAREFENCNHRKQTILCFRDNFNGKKAA